jgi:RNA polymerase sigma factor (TIGR02999 family)
MQSAQPDDITRLLQELAAGDAAAAEPLADAVYAQLRRIAASLMSAERRGHTLQPTQLAGEAYMSLVAQRDRSWQNRAHFFAVAAQAMRRLLVDYGRRTRALKRGGPLPELPADFDAPDRAIPFDEILGVHEALDRLAVLDPQQAQIVELRYFGGLTEEEAATVLRISTRTVKRDWAVARAWLHAELTRPTTAPTDAPS